MKICLFRTARAAALAFPLCLPEALVPRGQAAPAVPAGEEYASFIDKFWQEAWGRAFVPDRSCMLVQALAPGVFDVQVSDGERIVADGTWFEILRLEAPRPDGPPEPRGASRLSSIDLAVTAGVLVGSTGSIQPVFTLEVTAAPGAPAGRGLPRGLVPVGVAGDAAGAVQRAAALYAQLVGAAPVLAGGEPGFELGGCRCAEQLGDGQFACLVGFVACRRSCQDMMSAAFEACAQDGPPDPECVAAALNAFMACQVSCFANFATCLDKAFSRFIHCQDECLINPLVSDHEN